jgi:hypothetical protein
VLVRVGGDEGEDDAGQREPVADRDVLIGPVRSARFDHPVAVVEVRRHVQRHRPPVAVPGVERGREGRGGVDDEQVAGVEDVGELVEPPVLDDAGTGDEQPHAVPGETSVLGRFVGLRARREPEGRHGQHGHDATAGVRSAAR